MANPPTEKPGIVLFNPSPWRGTHYYGLPLPLLAISALPHEAGYPITIVVEDVDDDPEEKVMEACEGALLFGVTSLTGTMIAQGLEMCRKVRERFPDLPIVWGGTHPSIAPEQTCEHPLVDIVVAGQGEGVFMDLIHALEEGRPLESVPGILYKRDGKVVKNPCRETVDIDELPNLPFELIDMERFIWLYSSTMKHRLANRRGVTYYTSYGCPFSCSFCSEPLTSNRRWFKKSPEKVIEELTLLHENHGVDVIVFEDPILFVDMRRVKRIAELILERGLKIAWTGTSRLDTIKKIDQETWDLLKKSGLLQIYIGVESAHPVVLKAIGKKYTADDIVEVSRILYEQGVTLVCSFIQGIPVDTPEASLQQIMHEDMVLASKTLVRMHEVNPKAQVTVFMYTPYPGSVAFHLGTKYGFKPPDSLEGWCNFIHQENQVPWLLPEQEAFARLSLLGTKALRGNSLERIHRKKLKGSLLYVYSAITRARFRHAWFKYPVEQHIVRAIARRTMKERDPEGQNKGMLL